ncbi:MAG: FtsW/RodA/SpoVE family cell cycle protein, partial [Parabacteroides sp.]
TSTLISCVYFGIILSVSRFGANMGNEDNTLEDSDSDQETESAASEEGIVDKNVFMETKVETGGISLTAVKSSNKEKEKAEI